MAKREKSPPKWYNVALDAAAALVWTANCAVLIAYGQDDTEPLRVLLALDLLCALIWWISLAAALTRRRRARTGEQT